MATAGTLAELAARWQADDQPIPPDHFNIDDVSAGYLGAVMFANPSTREAVMGKDPLVEFPPLEGEQHTRGYLGAMVLASARPAMVEGSLNGRRVLVKPNSRLIDVLTEYLTDLGS